MTKPTEPSKLRMAATVGSAASFSWAASPRLFVATIAVQGVAAAGVAAQLLVGRDLLTRVIEASGSSGSVSSMTGSLVVLLLVSVLSDVLAGSTRHLGQLMTEASIRYSQGRLLSAVNLLDSEAFEKPELYDQIQRSETQGLLAPLRISTGLVGLLAGALKALAVSIALVSVQPVLVALLLLGFLPAWYLATLNSRDQYSFSFGQSSDDRMRTRLQRILLERGTAAEVRANEATGFLFSRWSRLADQRVDRATGVAMRNLRRVLAGSLASASLSTGVIGLVIWFVLSERMSIAEGGIAVLALSQLSAGLRSVGDGAAGLYESMRFLGDALGFMEHAAAQATMRTHSDVTRLGACSAGLKDAVEVVDICYRYPASPGDSLTLTGVNLKIQRGEIVALVGENGSGKTTLAKVLAGLLPPSSGTIMWDGININEIPSADYRAAVSVLFQDFARYPLSGWENIGLGDPSRIDDRHGVEAAAKAATADSVLCGLERGYETLLSREFTGGTDLSVGEWQRVAIARALFRTSSLVILDEPSASLDPRAEFELFSAIRSAFRDRAVLFVTHRLSSVRIADRIAVMADGEIIETGSHDELIQLDGEYAQLSRLQQSPADQATGVVTGTPALHLGSLGEAANTTTGRNGTTVFHVGSIDALPPEIQRAVQQAVGDQDK